MNNIVCWHKWTVAEKEILPSFLEQVAAMGQSLQSIPSAKVAAKKPCIVTYRCAKCGAEKVERI